MGAERGFVYPAQHHTQIQQQEALEQAEAWGLVEQPPRQDTSTPPIGGDEPARYGGIPPHKTAEGPGTPNDPNVARITAEQMMPQAALGKELRKHPVIGDKKPDRLHVLYSITETEEKGAATALYRTLPVTPQPVQILSRDNNRRRALITVVYSTPGDGDFVAIGNRELAAFTWDPSQLDNFPPMTNAWLLGAATQGAADNEYLHVNAATAETNISPIPVTLISVTVNTPDTVAATVTLFDTSGTSAANPIAVIKLPTSGGGYSIPFGLVTKQGLAYSATGFTGGGDVTIVYSPSGPGAEFEQTIEIKHCADVWACYVPNGSASQGQMAILGIESEYNDQGLRKTAPATQHGSVDR